MKKYRVVIFGIFALMASIAYSADIVHSIFWNSILNTIAITTKGDGTKNAPVETIWKSYAPTVTSDGTTPSIYIWNSVFRYKQIGKTVCLQGHISLGNTLSGVGGTYIRMTLPVNAKTGLIQPGIGVASLGVGGVSTPSLTTGSGVIESSDNTKIRLGKNNGSWFIPGDIGAGYALGYIAPFACYEID
jgi:hypothetical protein